MGSHFSRRTAEGRGFVQFHLVTWVPCGVVVFFGEFGFVGFVFCRVCCFCTQFANHCMTSSHTRESVADKAEYSISYGAKKINVVCTYVLAPFLKGE